jgi:16S rRNA U1498 N3-methylase RsmE
MGKIIKFKTKLKKLPAQEQKDILEAIIENPKLIRTVQKSMQLGFSDLPLFFENNQTELF